jgi:hypothetical protein
VVQNIASHISAVKQIILLLKSGPEGILSTILLNVSNGFFHDTSNIQQRFTTKT